MATAVYRRARWLVVPAFLAVALATLAPRPDIQSRGLALDGSRALPPATGVVLASAAVDADDFRVAVRIVQRLCESGSCWARTRVELTRAPALNPNLTYRVTYVIFGGDAPYAEQLEIRRGEYRVNPETIVDIRPTTTALFAVVVRAERYEGLPLCWC